MASKEDIAQAKVMAYYQSLFSGEDGKAVLADLSSRFHLDSSTFSTDPNQSAYNQGQRDVILYILATLQIDVMQYLSTIIQENDYEY